MTLVGACVATGLRVDMMKTGFARITQLDGLRGLPALRTRLILASFGLAIFALAALRICSKHGLTTTANLPLGNLVIYECTLGIAVAAFLLAMLRVGYPLLASWPLVWIGKISYSIYLVHLSALYLFPKHIGIAIAATTLYSLVLWFTIESPSSFLQRIPWKSVGHAIGLRPRPGPDAA